MSREFRRDAGANATPKAAIHWSTRTLAKEVGVSGTPRLRRGVFTGIPKPTAAIRGYPAYYNENPKAFIWTVKANDILSKVVRANSA
ncbi:MAG: hypothetical protein ACYCY1_12650 [Sulfuriferula sp.]